MAAIGSTSRFAGAPSSGIIGALMLTGAKMEIDMLRQLASGLVPILLVIASVPLIVGAVSIWIRRYRSSRQSPLTRDFLRPPGHSLRARIDEANIDVETSLLAVMMIPVLAYATHVTQSHFAGLKESLGRTAFLIVLTLLLILVTTRKLVMSMQERRRLVLGLEGELATGEELNQLMLDGCRVFHDVVFPYGNIDHVVVSESGVFCVETKMRGKLNTGDGDAKAVVDYDRSVIRFPDGEYRLPIDQLESQAKWLSEFLSSSVGRSIEVEPILAFPGWYIERIGRGRILVINPHKPLKFFRQNRSVLSPQAVQQIAHQLEQRCRDVTPSYRKSRRWETAAAKR